MSHILKSKYGNEHSRKSLLNCQKPLEAGFRQFHVDHGNFCCVRFFVLIDIANFPLPHKCVCYVRTIIISCLSCHWNVIIWLNLQPWGYSAIILIIRLQIDWEFLFKILRVFFKDCDYEFCDIFLIKIMHEKDRF